MTASGGWFADLADHAHAGAQTAPVLLAGEEILLDPRWARGIGRGQLAHAAALRPQQHGAAAEPVGERRLERRQIG